MPSTMSVKTSAGNRIRKPSTKTQAVPTATKTQEKKKMAGRAKGSMTAKEVVADFFLGEKDNIQKKLVEDLISDGAQAGAIKMLRDGGKDKEAAELVKMGFKEKAPSTSQKKTPPKPGEMDDSKINPRTKGVIVKLAHYFPDDIEDGQTVKVKYEKEKVVVTW